MYLANAISHKKEGKKEIERFLVDRKKVAHIFNEKQQDILQLLLDGHTTVEIAEKLYFSISDIRSNFGRMLKIVDCADRTQLAVTAIRNGWVFCVRK
ncbi:response regulator transcription factor [Evansella clarkii]|uniref:response regulator transcription factor n=1 Tax=Evansella clarkii TaxID=79879 RepID=UPI00147674CC|nr:LuxR C-terminal-related transcriptional regulator [Evansella clarkii]